MENQAPNSLDPVQNSYGSGVEAAFAQKEKAKQWCAGIFVFLVLCIFPLVYHDYYFDMIETKYIAFGVCVGILAVGVFLVVPCFWYAWYSKLPQERKAEEKKKYTLSNIWKSFSIPDKAVLAFWIVEIISTISSDYPYESFWGNEGRFSGLFMTTLYMFAYFAVSRFLKLKRGYLDAYLGFAMLVCLFGITDFFKMDILHFKEFVSERQQEMYVSTLGNINTYTAFVAMVSAVASVLFATAKGWKYKSYYYICMAISFLALIMGLSDNAYLALAALFGFLPLYLFGKKSGIKQYLIIVATFLSAVQCVGWISAAYGDRVFRMDGAINVLIQFKGLLAIVLMLWALILVWQCMDMRAKSAKVKSMDKQAGYAAKAGNTDHVGNMSESRMAEEAYKLENRDKLGMLPRYLWIGLILAVVAGVSIILYDCNVAGNQERYGAFANYLIFNDDWGTHRGYIWRIAMENFREFPLWHKIVGHGPDTFGIMTYFNNYYDMLIRYDEIFDNAHNEYLNFLITTGFAGLTAYLTFIISALCRGFKRAGQNPLVAAMLFAVLCYSAQAFVNLNLPIATPIMWMFLMMSMAGVKETVK